MSRIQLTIAEMLEEKNMTVKEFSEKAGIAYNTALALKRGSSNRIDFETLEKVCKVFDCQPGDLIILVDN